MDLSNLLVQVSTLGGSLAGSRKASSSTGQASAPPPSFERRHTRVEYPDVYIPGSVDGTATVPTHCDAASQHLQGPSCSDSKGVSHPGYYTYAQIKDFTRRLKQASAELLTGPSTACSQTSFGYRQSPADKTAMAQSWLRQVDGSVSQVLRDGNYTMTEVPDSDRVGCGPFIEDPEADARESLATHIQRYSAERKEYMGHWGIPDARDDTANRPHMSATVDFKQDHSVY